MNEHSIGWLDDPRLAEHALSPSPVWLWRADGAFVLWANPEAAAVFDAATPRALSQRDFEADHPAVKQIARLAGTLPHGGAPRLERLRGFGGNIGGTLLCLCSRIVLVDNTAAILVVSSERAGKDLNLPERASRLIADIARPAAVFSADGELVEATASARALIGNKSDLNALGAGNLARAASLNGRATSDSAVGPIEISRLGAGATVTLLAVFSDNAKAAPTANTTEAPSARRLPFRFLWQMDAAARFTHGAENFAAVIGSQASHLLERPWAELADALHLDRDGKVARALAAHETWSGINVQWPIAGSNERIAIEMSAMPIFDRDRQLQGFRGFAICRDAARLDEVQHRVEQPAPAPPAPIKPPLQIANDRQANVLTFPPQPAQAPPTPSQEPSPSLSPGEHSAFEELARELNARLKGRPSAEPAATDEFDGEPASSPPQLQNPSRPVAAPVGAAQSVAPTHAAPDGRPILEKLPIGILVYRLNNLLYANRAFLDWTGYASLQALNEAGGLDALFIETAGLVQGLK